MLGALTRHMRLKATCAPVGMNLMFIDHEPHGFFRRHHSNLSVPREFLIHVLNIIQQVPLAVNKVVNLPGSIPILPSAIFVTPRRPSDTNGLPCIAQVGVDLDPRITGGDDGDVEF